jgi:DNA-binding NarL/FixJ family response regulator
MQINVIVVEDHPSTRIGLATILSMVEGVEVISEFETGRETLDQIDALQPDMVLLNVGLPDMPGEEVAHEIRKKGLESKIVVYSAMEDEQHVMGMVNAGAAGYVLKSEPPEKILEAIRAIAEGRLWLSDRIIEVLMRFRRGELPECPPLTPREIELLRLLPQGYTNQQIAGNLKITETTVKNHLTNIYGKLGVKGRAGAIAWAWQHGLVKLF